MSETLTNKIVKTESIEADMKDWDINGHTLYLKIEKN